MCECVCIMKSLLFLEDSILWNMSVMWNYNTASAAHLALQRIGWSSLLYEIIASLCCHNKINGDAFGLTWTARVVCAQNRFMKALQQVYVLQPMVEYYLNSTLQRPNLGWIVDKLLSNFTANAAHIYRINCTLMLVYDQH